MQKNIISLLLIICSCMRLPSAEGDLNEVIIIVSPEDRSMIEFIVDKTFDKHLNTPQKEYYLNVKYVNPWEFNDVKRNKTIIVMSIDNPSDSTGDLLMSKFIDNYEVDKMLQLKDLYARGQLITLIHSFDAVDLNETFDDYGNWLIDEIESHKLKSLQENLFKNGKNKLLSKKIMSTLGFTLDFQIDYKEIKIDSLNSFAWLGRGYPYRWITLYKADKKKYANSNAAWKQFEEDISIFIPEITISNHFRKTTLREHNNQKVTVLNGLYEHEISDSGGPFATYMFDMKGSNDLILITGYVNYPGRKKIKLLEEIENIIFTINLGD